MDETARNLTEVSTHKTTDNTTWYSTEKIPENEACWYPPEINEHTVEVLNRVIIKDEEGENKSYKGGSIHFSIHNKILYDRIFEYFDLQRSPSTFVSLLDKPIEFKLCTNERITRWTSSVGSINCWHEWYGPKGWKDPGEIGHIEFNITSEILFEKFTAYATKFKP